MAAIKGKDTKPEMIVRRLLHSLGYRYRLHRKDIPGNPDIVFIGRRKAIQVHGCFWHQHSGCKAAHVPLSRLEYWQPKLARNVSRDSASLEALGAAGWDVLVLWECEIRRGGDVQDRLVQFLGPPAA
ncbi:very short patch repair endonuclease [Magnetospirillum sp. 64-120]|uniref:very short patch repair endonuclease n=1 Tax=Magnetospirillum sp. 64-120 TaxID=1895778 RepID=UPI0025B84E11|nr:very short patch repair endonuclease [Magnetospirillum sp. 64-120]